MFVPVIILMMLAIGLDALLGWLECVVAPWQDEMAGRNRRARLTDGDIHQLFTAGDELHHCDSDQSRRANR